MPVTGVSRGGLGRASMGSEACRRAAAIQTQYTLPEPGQLNAEGEDARKRPGDAGGEDDGWAASMPKKLGNGDGLAGARRFLVVIDVSAHGKGSGFPLRRELPWPRPGHT